MGLFKKTIAGGFESKSDTWATSVSGGDKYYATWHDAMVDQYGAKYYKGGKRQKRAESAARAEWEKERELQKKEFEQVKGASAQTVNYGSAITDLSNISGEVLTTEEEQMRAALALQEEEELLGTRMGMLGTGGLKGLK